MLGQQPPASKKKGFAAFRSVPLLLFAVQPLLLPSTRVILLYVFLRIFGVSVPLIVHELAREWQHPERALRATRKASISSIAEPEAFFAKGKLGTVKGSVNQHIDNWKPVVHL